MLVIVDSTDHLVAISEDDAVWHLDEGLRIEHIDGEITLEYPPEMYIFVNGEIVYDEEGAAKEAEERSLEPFEVMAALMQNTEVLDTLPDEVMAHMASYMEEWSGDGVAYAAGDKRQYDDKPYRCLQAHTSQAGWNPKDAPSLWARILASADPDNPLPWEQPDSTNPYMKGDRVTHNGKVWESDVDNNVWEPGVYCWTEVE